MTKKIITIFTIVTLISQIGIFAQGYEISINIKNLKDSTVYLGHHFGNRFFLVDTIKLDKSGDGVFKKQKTLGGGLYFILFPQGQYFDFLIDKDQNFSISADTIDFIRTVKFKNSYQNERFFKYQNYLTNSFIEINRLKEKQKALLTKMDSLMAVEQQIQVIKNKIYLEKEEIVKEHPDSIISVLIKAGLPIIPPPAPRDTSGTLIDSLYGYHYVKNHFFDNFDFSDERITRSSLLNNKVLEYLTRVIAPFPDTVLHEVDFIIEKSKANVEVYKFILNTLFAHYSRSKIISDENVFVHIAENYFINGKAPWVSDDFKSKLKKDIDIRKPNLIGEKAPAFSMQSIDNKTINLREVQNNYVILYFFNDDCSICDQVSPELMNFYRIIKDRGVSIIGINTGEDKEAWKKYVEDKHLNWINVWDPKNKSGFRELYNIAGTPLLFLLDEDQKIVAKRITVEQLMGFFNSL
ncbi:MAG: redoxin domain-containing protein [Bacteroidota bacterium]